MSEYLYSVDDNSEELMHYGVLGMKWHQHRARANYAAARRYSSQAKQIRKAGYTKEADAVSETAAKYRAKGDSHSAKAKTASKQPRATGKDIAKASAAGIGAGALIAAGHYAAKRYSSRGNKPDRLRLPGAPAALPGPTYSRSDRAKMAGKSAASAVKSAAKSVKNAAYNSKIATNVRRNKYANKYGISGPKYVNVKYKRPKRSKSTGLRRV